MLQKNPACPLGLFYLVITHNVETEPRYSLTSNGNTLHCEYCIRNVITMSKGLGKGFEPSFLNLLGLIFNGTPKLFSNGISHCFGKQNLVFILIRPQTPCTFAHHASEVPHPSHTP